jgi:hypothetical protein
VLVILAAACGPSALVFVDYPGGTQLPLEMLSVTIDDGGETKVLRGDDIGGSSHRRGRPVPTKPEGVMRVSFRFEAQGVVASEGAVEVPLRDDRAYGFEILLDSVNPMPRWFGIQEARAFPLARRYQRSAADSIWVLWGTNSIKNPVTF